MKKALQIYRWKSLLIAILFLLLFVSSSFAAEGSGDWRKTYDMAMRWVNFAIFMTVIVKFGKKPMQDFIGQLRDETASELQFLEKEKERLRSEVDQTLKTGDESKQRLKDLKERILAEGERRKNQIIEDAKLQSTLILEDAKRKANNRILKAKETFRNELIDAAANLALQKLPSIVSGEDQEKRLAQFIETI